jgi:conjugative relaxase-like TrwC/TraI family protein
MYDIRPAYNAKSVKNYLAYDEPGIDLAFGGRGFDHLGIDPAEMTLKKFNSLIDNKNPETKESLTPRNVDGRIVGNYVTLSPPKDFTLLAEFAPERVREKAKEALREAGDYVMKRFIEPEATVRERKGPHADRETGNLMWVRLHHTLDRPHEGRIMPQQHLHYFIINATYDESRGRFFAAKLRGGWWESAKIKRQFHKRLRENLERDLGIKTKGMGMRWRVDGIDRDTVDRFSLRGKAAKANLEAGVSRDFAALVGREPKMKLSQEDVANLRAEWEAMLTDRDKQCLNNIVARPKWGRRLHPGKKRLEFLRNIAHMTHAYPDPRKEVDFDITR